MLCASKKDKDPMKVGRFGRGFKTVSTSQVNWSLSEQVKNLGYIIFVYTKKVDSVFRAL